jgi:hypothetical protein
MPGSVPRGIAEILRRQSDDTTYKNDAAAPRRGVGRGLLFFKPLFAMKTSNVGLFFSRLFALVYAYFLSSTISSYSASATV